MKKIFILLLIVFYIVFLNPLWGSQKQTDNIAQISAPSLYNIDKPSLQSAMKAYFKNNMSLKALKVIEALSGEVYIDIYKDKENIIEEAPQESFLENYIKFTSIAKYEGEKVGEIIAYYEKDNSTIKFTKEEKKWLKDNHNIKIAYMNYWPTNNNSENIHTKYIDLLSKYGNINITLVKYDSWKDGFKDAKSGEYIHGILNLSWSEDREKNDFDYTEPYFFTPAYLIVKDKNKTIKSIEDLKNKYIYTKKDAITNQIIKQLEYKITPIRLDNDNQMYKALNQKDSKANALLSYMYDAKLLSRYNLKIADKFFNKFGEVYIGISKNQKEVFSIIEKAYNAIPKSELSKIQNKDYLYKDKTLPINLTNEEKEWLEKHPILKVGNEPDYAPWDFNINGKPVGYSVDYLNLLASKLGLELDYQLDTWDGLTKKLQSKELDFLHTMYKNDTTRKNILYSNPYKKIINAIFVHEDNTDIKSLDDLKDKVVSITKGDSTIVSLKELYPSMKIKEPDGYIETIKDVAFKRADATILELGVANYLINEFNIPNIKIIDEVEFKSKFVEYSYCFGVRDDYSILVSILNKAMEAVTDEEKKQLDYKWLNYSNSSKENKIEPIELSPDEKEWLLNHKEIRFTGDPDWLPFEAFNDDGEYIGIVSEHLKIFESMIGINFKYIKPKTWSDAVQMTLDKKVDMISEVVAENTVSKSMDYTLPYIKTPLVTIVHEESNIKSINDLNAFKDKKIAYVKDYGYIQELKKRYPNISFVEVPTVKEGLEKLTLKQIDIMILTLTIGSYNINTMGLSDLKIVGKLPIEMRLGFGVRKDWQILIQMLNRAIDSLDKQEQQNIMKHWLIDESKKIDLTDEEENWININQTLDYVYDIDWAPFEWKNEVDEHTGIIYDFLALIEERSGLKLNQINTNSWEDALSLVENKNADMFSAIGENENRKKYLNFTENSIFTTPYVFVTRLDDKRDYLDSFKNIDTQKVALVHGYSIEDIIKINVPNLNYQTVNTVKEGFEKLKDNQIDIFIVNAATAKYYINRLDFDELKIAAKTDFSLQLKIALRKELGDIPLSIIDKALGSINENERSDIYFKWTEVLVEKKIDWNFVYKILFIVLILIIGFTYWNRKLKQIVNEKTKELKELNQSLENKVVERTKELNDERKFIQSIMNSQTNFVISTDGISLRTANKAFFNFFEVKNTEEFIEKYGDCICDTFEINDTNEFIQKTMGEEIWLDYVYNRPQQIHKTKIVRNDKEYIFTITTDRFMFKGEELKTAVFNDITEIEEIRKNIEMILSNIMLPVLITSTKTRKILYANSYAQKQYEIPIDELIGSNIDKIYVDTKQKDNILIEMQKHGYVENFEQTYKTKSGKEFIALLSVKPITYKNEDAYIGMVVDITKQKEIEAEIRNIHKLTRDSIEYASLIQHALIPDEELIKKYFSDSFTLWEPKDIVGGDIYLFDELRSDDECLLFVVDCTGHGVPGAFVTMLVKAIERQIGAVIAADPSLNVSPAWILQYFNKTMKKLLKQESKDSISNAGFDGGIIYFNKRDKILKFAGAETSLYYVENNELKTIKGDRHSIGYKKSDANYTFKEHILEVENDMRFYISTDGYIDQNGGEKGFSMGKTKFKNIIEENYQKSFKEQKEVFINKLVEYQKEHIRNDDITIIGFKI